MTPKPRRNRITYFIDQSADVRTDDSRGGPTGFGKVYIIPLLLLGAKNDIRVVFPKGVNLLIFAD
jgi:hypothetical protein